MSTADVLDEARAIAILERGLALPASRSISVGIGDDAAVLELARGSYVWSVDSNVEGVHFDLAWLSLEHAAARAYSAALSDLAAMGAMPVAALCALSVPRGVSRAQLAAVARGQRRIANLHACPLIGGNLCRAERFEFHTTVLGRAARPRLRSGATPGDEVWLAAPVGLAAMGLELLQRKAAGEADNVPKSTMAHCVRAWREPLAQIERGLELGNRATSLIDISDGLASEARHLAKASGVRLVLSERALRANLAEPLVRAARALHKDPLDYCLQGGEDYVLCATGRRSRRPSWALTIGRVESGAGAWLETEDGEQLALQGGFDHLTSGPKTAAVRPRATNSPRGRANGQRPRVAR
jgi:thiamine-monophosphate kinase